MRAREKKFAPLYNYIIHLVKLTTLDEMAIEAHKQHISYGELQVKETCELLRRLRPYEKQNSRFK